MSKKTTTKPATFNVGDRVIAQTAATLQQLATGTITESQGHVIKTIGDSVLADFDRFTHETRTRFDRIFDTPEAKKDAKDRADRIGHKLRQDNHAVAILHSNRTQSEREQALRGFRDGKFEVLEGVATAKVRAKGQYEKDQGGVWQEVAQIASAAAQTRTVVTAPRRSPSRSRETMAT